MVGEEKGQDNFLWGLKRGNFKVLQLIILHNYATATGSPFPNKQNLILYVLVLSF